MEVKMKKEKFNNPINGFFKNNPLKVMEDAIWGGDDEDTEESED